MARAASDHLDDALEAIAAIEGYTRKGRKSFESSAMMRDAVVARLIQLGQAVKDAQAAGIELARLRPEVPWKSVAGMRDRLAHKYWLLDVAIVWAVVEKDLPPVRAALVQLLKPAARKRRS